MESVSPERVALLPEMYLALPISSRVSAAADEADLGGGGRVVVAMPMSVPAAAR